VVQWHPPEEQGIVGYNVYRADGQNAPFVKLNGEVPFTTTRYYDFGGSEAHVYMIRAVKAEQTPGGSYYNASQGVLALDV